MPKKFSRFENAVRTFLKEYVKRGKVDLFISFEDYTESEMCVRYNQRLAESMWTALRRWRRPLESLMT